jgi:MFS transporter, MHS family, shikimate and dehydroshikimate transport protein
MTAFPQCGCSPGDLALAIRRRISGGGPQSFQFFVEPRHCQRATGHVEAGDKFTNFGLHHRESRRGESSRHRLPDDEQFLVLGSAQPVEDDCDAIRCTRGCFSEDAVDKPVLVASLIVMGLATFVIGLLPTYAAVGILAPILLVTVRIIQGIAFGAEWGGAILMSYEHAPWRQKGKYTGMVQAGFPVGLLLANLVFLVSVHLGGDWAWRVPFLASIFLVIVGLIIRAKVPESPVFEDVKEHGDIVKSPIVQVIKTDWRNILRGIGLRIAETAGYAVSITYMISYLKNEGLATKSETLTALCIASAIGIVATMAWARLTDKIGRRTVYLYACAFAVPFGVLMFLLVNTGIFLLIIATFVLAYGLVQNSMAGAQGAWFPELFTANTRASGASLAYQISAMVSGFTPFITTLLFVSYGWIGPALLFSSYAAIGLVAALVTRETWGPRERELADEAAARPAPADIHQAV